MSIDLIIVDDHPIIRAGLVKVMQVSEKFRIVGEFPTGVELLEFLKTSHADIILLDLQMPGADGVTLVPKIKELSQAKIAIFTMHEGEGYFRDALRAGVNGYILKTEELTAIPLRLETIHSGVFYSTNPYKGLREADKLKYKITEKEHQILNMLINGFTAKEIGERIGLSKRTVEYYSRKLKEKFDAENLVDLVNRAKDFYYK